MALGKWYEATVIKIENLTKTTKQFWLQIPSLEKIDFRAGQFMTFDLPIHEKRNRRWRSYSIASASNQSNILEFAIVKLEGGAGTKYLFEDIKIGSQIKLRGPLGVFTLPKTLDKDICFICTGTGIAPFRAMLHEIRNKNLIHQRIDLIFGTRTLESMLFMDEMRELEKAWPNFHYHIALSREQSAHWKGTKGYVHQIYEKLYADQRDAYFYICGWDDMINEAISRLEGMNYKKRQQIVYESYS